MGTFDRQSRLCWARLSLALCAVSIPATAEDEFYRRGQEGWFWYELLVDPVPKPEPVFPRAPAGNEPMPLSAAWFREHMQSFMDRAIDEPTPENVRAYLYLQRVMMDKGTRFADVSQQVVMGDPMLDEISRRPLATYAANRMDRVAGEHRDSVLRSVAQQAGIFFFYRSDCPYCHVQAPIIESLTHLYGFEVFAIAVDGKPLPDGSFSDFRVDTGQAQTLGVTTVPAMFLVSPPDTITPVGQGAMTLDELSRRLVSAAHQQGWINEETYHATRPVRPGISLALTPQELNQRMLADPEFLVRYLRAQGGIE